MHLSELRTKFGHPVRTRRSPLGERRGTPRGIWRPVSRGTKATLLLQRILMVLVVVLLAYHVSRRGSAPPQQGFSYYTDHYRHMRFAWEALSIGARVYVTPLRDFAIIGDPLAYSWTNTEYLYPPSALLAYLPFALLTYGGVLPFTPVATALVCAFALAAAYASLRVWREGLERSASFESRALWTALAAGLFIHGMGWGLLGQYDTVVVLVLLLSVQAKSRSWRILGLGFAFSLKFQALLVFPFFVHEVWLLAQRPRGSLRRDAPALIGLALTGLTLLLVLYLGQRGALSPVREGPLHIRELLHHRVTLGCVLFTTTFAAVAFAKRQPEAGLIVVWTFGAFASLSLIQGWYVLYLFPLAAFASRRAGGWVAVYTLGLLYFIGWVPDVYRVAAEVLILPY